MKTSGNTVLIIGGSAGIGFELARKFSENGNELIITGRNEEQLIHAASQLKNVTPIVSDFTREDELEKLIESIAIHFPKTNVLINNAALAFIYNVLDERVNIFERIRAEMHTNFLSVTRITEHLLPQLKNQTEAGIVNVTSIAAFLPGSLIGYSASKAALRSYTISLRLVLEESTRVKVFELVPPLVNTEFSKDIGGIRGISPKQVADEFFTAWQKDEYEIHVGQTADLYRLFLSSPAKAIEQMKSLRKRLQSEK